MERRGSRWPETLLGVSEDRRAVYRAYDWVRRYELKIVIRLLGELLPEMPKPWG